VRKVIAKNIDPDHLLRNSAIELPPSFVTDLIALLYDSKLEGILHPNEIRDALSSGQLVSKLLIATIIIDEIYQQQQEDGIYEIAIVGGWIGTLAKLLVDRVPDANITSIDIDPRCRGIAEQYVNQYKFTALTADMYQYTGYHLYDLIINTSCEHIADLREWLSLIPKGKRVILQSNNADDIVGHINTVKSTDEFIAKAGLTKVEQVYQLEFPMYTRYTLVGIV
jgi:hypothetical protein